ncbi:unnamed protein product [Umbelopsis ramanniana]
MSTNSIISSMSWIVEKSPTDLIPMLKNAYTALKDKERDLVLAAEIGKSLLENNIQLKSKYETLLQQLHMYQNQSSASSAAPPSATHSSEDNHHQCSNSNNNRIPSKKASLEEAESLEKSNKKVTKKLEAEIAALKDDLNIAAQKIQELQDMNQQAAERQRRLEAEAAEKSESPSAESYELIGNMFEKVGKLEIENISLQAAKFELEAKLSTTFRDLRLLKDQFESFQFTQEDYDSLQEAYHRQFSHIAELNDSLEEHRNLVQKLRDRGMQIGTPNQTPTPSLYDGTKKEDPSLHKKSLLSELESEWFKGISHNSQNMSSPSHASSISRMLDFAQATEDSLLSFYNNPAEYALSTILSGNGITDPSILDEAVEFINRLEQDDLWSPADSSLSDFDPVDLPEFGLYPDCDDLVEDIDDNGLVVILAPKRKAAISGKMRRLLRSFFRTIWKWCRFAMILTAAVLINLWHGPKSMLIDY